MDTALLLEAERRGLLPADKAGLLAEARKRGLVSEGPGFLERQWDAIRGNAAETAPDVTSQEFANAAGYGARSGLGQALTDFFGSDEASKHYALSHVAGAKEAQDANGNPMIELPDGQRFYVNKPGLSAKDVLGAVGKVAAFTPGGKLAGAARSLVGRMAAGSALAAGTEAARQGAFEPEMSPGEMGIAALGGGIGEMVPAVAGAAVRKAREWLGGGSSAMLEKGKDLAAKLGVEGLDDAALVKLGQRAAEVEQGAKPAAILAESEFGLPMTRGQKTGDFSQLAQEERLRNAQGAGGDVMRAALDRQARAYEGALKDVRGAVSGGRARSSVAENFDTVADAVRSNAARQRQAISDAYGNVDMRGTRVASVAALDLPRRLHSAVQEFGIAKELHPATASTLDDIARTVGELPEGAGLKLGAIENGRRIINSRMDAASNAADRAALRKVKAEYDAWMSDALDNAMLKGDANTLASLAKARDLRARYARAFEGNDQAGRLIEKALSSETPGEQLANLVLGSGQVSWAAGARTIKALRVAIGDNPDAWDSLRSSVLLRATTNRAGGNLSPGAAASNLKELIRERPALLSQLYSPGEISRLQRFTAALDSMVRTGDFAKSSGTAERGFRYLESVIGNVPGLGHLLSALKAPADLSAAYRATSPLAPKRGDTLPALLPALGVQLGQ